MIQIIRSEPASNNLTMKPNTNAGTRTIKFNKGGKRKSSLNKRFVPA